MSRQNVHGWLRIVAAISLLCLLAGASPARAETSYGLLYTAQFLPSQGLARVSIGVDQATVLLRKLEFDYDAERMFNFEGDGVIQTEGARLVWEIPDAGGQLRYAVRVDHLREDAEYDARLSHDWALLRGGDLFPAGVTTSRKSAVPETRLRLRLPTSWKALVPFPKAADGTYLIEDGGTRFDRPAGWLLLGSKLNTRTEEIAGMTVRVGGPPGQDVRVRDMVALLRWTLPTMQKIVGTLPKSLLVVSAEDPMWRGGLSGPASLYLHANRPLIEKDGTSPLLHELVHVLMRALSDDRGDWIVEGLAEYYSLELLLRSGTISQDDYDATMAHMLRKAAPMTKLRDGVAGFSSTARAVLIMSNLDRDIRKKTDGARSLDDVFRALTQRRGSLSVEEFTEILNREGEGDYSSKLPPVARK